MSMAKLVMMILATMNGQEGRITSFVRSCIIKLCIREVLELVSFMKYPNNKDYQDLEYTMMAVKIPTLRN